MVDEDSQSIVIGSGEDRVAINLKQAKVDQPSSLLLTSVLIEIGDIEIEIRRSTKKPVDYKKGESSVTSTGTIRPPSVTYRNENGAQDKKKNISEEKPSSNQPPYWDYSASHGPHVWTKLFPQLEWKKFQSPIRIYTDQCEYAAELAQHPFQFTADENCCQTLENNGRSFQVSGKGFSHITGGPAPDEFQFLQFHMHWGSNDLEGSEHVLDGVRLPAELHIVTWNTSRYRTPQEAASSEEFDGLMVFGILIKIVPTDNAELGKLIDLLSKITHKGDKINLDRGVVSLRALLPQDMRNYYTYDGSLTTPMCNESVRWVVFREKMGLSRRQLDQLRQLKQTCKGDTAVDSNINTNYRPVMPLNGRIVYRSFQ